MNTFTDFRDGETYKIVRIGNLIWLAENLRYRGVEHHFPGRDSDCVEKYGCLYTWPAAVKVCPNDGWRLPTKDEYLALIDASDCVKMKNSSSIRNSSWSNGSNKTRFSALPAGRRLGRWFGTCTCFWSSTLYKSDYAASLCVYPQRAFVDYYDVHDAFSVRYVKEI